jgi:hypothetical protein
MQAQRLDGQEHRGSPDRRESFDRRESSDRREARERREKLESEERADIAAELASQLKAVQQMGQRLANVTHGAEYDLVLELNELLHEARVQIALVQTDSANDWPTTQFGDLDKPR